MKEDETIDTFTKKLTTLVNKAASLGHTIEDSVVVRKLLNAVPDKFLQIVASIEQYSDLDKMSVDEAIGRLETFEESFKDKENLLENMEDLTSLKAENKARTIINLKGKNDRLLKKIQETNLKSHVTDVTTWTTIAL
ncbi:hypothetical protein Tco_1012402 [Tanacetum coccineum]